MLTQAFIKSSLRVFLITPTYYVGIMLDAFAYLYYAENYAGVIHTPLRISGTFDKNRLQNSFVDLIIPNFTHKSNCHAPLTK